MAGSVIRMPLPSTPVWVTAVSAGKVAAGLEVGVWVELLIVRWGVG